MTYLTKTQTIFYTSHQRRRRRFSSINQLKRIAADKQQRSDQRFLDVKKYQKTDISVVDKNRNVRLSTHKRVKRIARVLLACSHAVF